MRDILEDFVRISFFNWKIFLWIIYFDHVSIFPKFLPDLSHLMIYPTLLFSLHQKFQTKSYQTKPNQTLTHKQIKQNQGRKFSSYLTIYLFLDIWLTGLRINVRRENLIVNVPSFLMFTNTKIFLKSWVYKL